MKKETAWIAQGAFGAIVPTRQMVVRQVPTEEQPLDILPTEEDVTEMPDFEEEVTTMAGLGSARRQRNVTYTLAALFLGTMGYAFYRNEIANKKAAAETPAEKKEVAQVEELVTETGTRQISEEEKLRLKQKAAAIMHKLPLGPNTKDMAPAVAPAVVKRLEDKGIDPEKASSEQIKEVMQNKFSWKKVLPWAGAGMVILALAYALFSEKKRKRKRKRRK